MTATTSGRRNSAFGYYSLPANTSGNANVAMGWGALFNGSTATFEYNVGIGAITLLYNTSGSRNTAIGNAAMLNSTGTKNTAVGDSAGSAWTSGTDNIALGSGANGLAGDTGTIRIGGGDNQTQTFIEGIHGASLNGSNEQTVCVDDADQLGPCSISSARFKEAIRTMDDTTALVGALRPVTFRFKPTEGRDGARPLQYGLIAEEVAEVLPTLVSYDDEGRPYTVRYSLLTPLLLNELQRHQAALREQQAELAELRQKVADLERKKRFRRR